MPGIISQSELLRRALRWVNDEHLAMPQKPIRELLEEAGMRYNLSPKDCRMLANLWAELDDKERLT